MKLSFHIPETIKVSDFHHFIFYQDISRRKSFMYNSLLKEEQISTCDLRNHSDAFSFSVSLPPHILHECLIAQLFKHVNIVAGLDDLFDLNDVGMAEVFKHQGLTNI